MFAVEARDLSGGLAFDCAFFQVFSFIVSDFALPDAKLGFEVSVFPIKLEDNERAAFDLAFAIKFVDLLTVQQKFADAFCGRNFMTRFFIRLNIGVVEKRFAVLDASKSIADVGFAGAN